MIIRIISQGQFTVKSSLFDELNTIDNNIVECVQNGDETGFKNGLSRLIGLILSEGTRIPDTELVESSVIVPPADMTLEEARQIFRSDGIFQG